MGMLLAQVLTIHGTPGNNQIFLSRSHFGVAPDFSASCQVPKSYLAKPIFATLEEQIWTFLSHSSTKLHNLTLKIARRRALLSGLIPIR